MKQGNSFEQTIYATKLQGSWQGDDIMILKLKLIEIYYFQIDYVQISFII